MSSFLQKTENLQLITEEASWKRCLGKHFICGDDILGSTPFERVM
jgi:hypothetical protein